MHTEVKYALNQHEKEEENKQHIFLIFVVKTTISVFYIKEIFLMCFVKPNICVFYCYYVV